MKQYVQLALYCLAVKEKYDKLPVQAGHFYVHPERAELRLVDIAKDELEAVLEEPNCRFCDYGAVCEWYKSP